MSEATPLNLWQKIVQVRMVAEGFSKDGKSYGYSYVTGNQVLGKIKDKMNELNLLLFPSTKVGEHHTHAYKTSKGKDALDFVVKGEMAYTWINGDNPSERETVTWAYYGQQDEISKAYGSGLTYSERYYLLKSLGLPTDEDDPDAKQRNDNHNNPANANTVPTKMQDKPTPTNAPAAQQNRASGKGTGPIGLVSDAQIKYCYRIKDEKHIDEDDFRRMIMEIGGRESIKEMTKKEASEFINLLNNYQRGA
ncbi:ERF family protein [Paenibacillus sp. HN-1]|uniref:ERF family protein n=1 Tax=Paenibacillus TaxID=44249 RepID=UPI001CAA066D|nr:MULTISPECIES: ERF family protein [Paenibacillus]MBY9081238.1 ERF family protein [Paenibacillus sp. CGMCC 1.18879]MBY9087275.1 ERF family protein [Paenibacillus sinensis]